MVENLEKFRSSESGRILFYVLLGVVLGLVLMIFAAPSKVSLFCNSGNNNGNDNAATFQPTLRERK